MQSRASKDRAKRGTWKLFLGNVFAVWLRGCREEPLGAKFLFYFLVGQTQTTFQGFTLSDENRLGTINCHCLHPLRDQQSIAGFV